MATWAGLWVTQASAGSRVTSGPRGMHEDMRVAWVAWRGL